MPLKRERLPKLKATVALASVATPPATAQKKSCACGQTVTASRSLPITRPSCLECVEKHLGAAWVLMAEHRDGYPHRVRAIGHLHEAEDESQAWPALHDAIRMARRAYQQRGEIPDFLTLVEIIVRAAL